MAWIGFDGQGRYKMTIKPGKRTLQHCENEFSLEDCVPDDGTQGWVTLDMEIREIELRLE